jgi:hypothetical protein
MEKLYSRNSFGDKTNYIHKANMEGWQAQLVQR